MDVKDLDLGNTNRSKKGWLQSKYNLYFSMIKEIKSSERDEFDANIFVSFSTDGQITIDKEVLIQIIVNKANGFLKEIEALEIEFKLL